jgi:acyl-CoA synthetase (AMP-forming)/AMP-acid ligase II
VSSAGTVTGECTTVAGLLASRALQHPARLSYSFLEDGESAEVQMTYGQADHRARAVAAALRDAGGAPGARVLLLLAPGLDYVAAFMGCLYAGVIAVPAYPPDPLQLDRALPRLAAIVGDATPVVVLTSSSLLGYLVEVTRQAPGLGGLRWLPVDALPEPSSRPGDLTTVDPEATAVLQYTSGSTAAPKGVMLSHHNLMHNSGLIQGIFGTSPCSRALVWLPPYHDMGLIGGLIQPLYADCPVFLMSPLHFLEDPLRWLRAISRFRVTASGGPNFAYDLCVRKSDPRQRRELDLSCWQVAFNGAEPIRPQTLRRFAEAFAPSGFRAEAFLRCYGLAEATLIVSGTGGVAGAEGRRGDADPAPHDGDAGHAAVAVDREALEQHQVKAADDDEAAVQLMSCGPSLQGQQLAIVDPVSLAACPARQVGEIWVSGPSVARGYWGKPAETDLAFGARIAGGDNHRFLRTGDLGFLDRGELVVTGRLKDLIIIRGKNHYPQDIELTAERADPVLRPGCSAAFCVEDQDGADGLVLVHEVRRQPGGVDVPAVTGRIREAVAREHGLQVRTVALLAAGGMPKTSSGKVQRWLCRAQFMAAGLPETGRDEAVPVPPARDLISVEQVLSAAPELRAGLLEGYLRDQIAAFCGLDGLGPDQPLLAAGLDSLAILQLRQQVEADLAVSLPLGAMLAGATVAELAGQLSTQLTALPGEPAATGSGTAADRAPSEEQVLPLSYGQRSIWLTQQIEPESTAYHVMAALRLAGPVDYAALYRALDGAVARHPMLRATFGVRDGEPVQVIHPRGQAAYAEHDAHAVDEATLLRRMRAAARRPFDLGSGPLLRLDIYRHPAGDVALLSAHHIITDFWSMSVLAKELGDRYTAYAAGGDIVLPVPAATYADVVAWQRSLLGDPGRLTGYWDEQVGDGVPPLALPPIAAGSSPGGSRSFSVPRALTRALKARSAAGNTTLYVLLLTAFLAALHSYTGQDDLSVGTCAAARARREFAEVIGCCMNPVMIRSRAPRDGSFRALVSRTQDQVIGALEHQEYPMILLSERHRARRAGMLFQAMFTFNRSPLPGDDLAALAMVGPPGARRSLGSLQVESFPLPPEEPSPPLDLVMAETDDALHGWLRYRAGALDAIGANRLLELFTTTLEMAATGLDRPVGDPGRREHVPDGSR